MCTRLSGGRDQGFRRRGSDVCAQAALSRLPELRQRVPVWSAKVQHANASSDEVRHVLRPFLRRTETDVCERLSNRRYFVRKV